MYSALFLECDRSDQATLQDILGVSAIGTNVDVMYKL